MGNKIRALLKKKGWTLSDLARAVGLSAATIHHYVTGYSAPTPETAAKIAAALDGELDDLATRERGVVGNRPGSALNAEKLRAAMELKGINGQELAKLVDVHPERVYAYRAGRARPSAETLKRLARALNVEPADLIAPAPAKPVRAKKSASKGRR